MDDKLHFAVDLYQGTAEYYDRYRLPYPQALIEDLIARTGVCGQGRLLDLACGTGRLPPARPRPGCRQAAALAAARRVRGAVLGGRPAAG
jgi:SAM-dependent methyltransferase